MDKKYEIIKNSYLANGLAFCGFKYQKYQNDEGNTVYSFKNSEELQFAIKGILNIRHTLEDKGVFK